MLVFVVVCFDKYCMLVWESVLCVIVGFVLISLIMIVSGVVVLVCIVLVVIYCMVLNRGVVVV